MYLYRNKRDRNSEDIPEKGQKYLASEHCSFIELSHEIFHQNKLYNLSLSKIYFHFWFSKWSYLRLLKNISISIAHIYPFQEF